MEEPFEHVVHGVTPCFYICNEHELLGDSKPFLNCQKLLSSQVALAHVSDQCRNFFLKLRADLEDICDAVVENMSKALHLAKSSLCNCKDLI